MKLSLFKMKFFRKRDKQKNDPELSISANGSPYAPFGSPDSPDHAPAAGASPRGRGLRGLKGASSKVHDDGMGGGSGGYGGGASGYQRGGTGATPASARVLQTLPDAVLGRIFAHVCPHSLDRTYEKCEDSSHGNTCMLCDMRDLAHCARACRRWRPVAEQALFTSIRIDTVHYCEREAILAEKRKRRSFFDRNAEPEDTADARLKLLCRGLRDDPTRRLGRYVQFLKIPYMLRESHHADIARTISVMPNLRYVDLPEGLFMDEPAYITLKVEVQAKCPDIRKMTYMNGAERSLEGLASGTLWPKLEVLELVKIDMDPVMMRHVLGSLSNLRALKVTETPTGPHAFSDEVLAAAPADDYRPVNMHMHMHTQSWQSSSSAGVPPLEEIVLTDTRRLTADGLMEYLGRPEARRALRVLTLSGTGVKPWTLQAILSLATSLRHLTIVDEVAVALPVAAGTKDIQPLASTSLETLNYEIAPAKGVSPYAGVTRSYYNYLSGSILSGGLPNLRAVYVRDAQFPDSLLSSMPLPPPGPISGAAFGDFGGGGSNGGGSSSSNYRPSSSSSASGAASMTQSPMSTGSLGQLQSPTGFLSPLQSPAFQQGATHRQSSSLQDTCSAAAALPLALPPKPWAGGGSSSRNPRFSSNNPFAGMISPQQMQTLEVFTKGDDDLDWSSIVVSGQEFDGGGIGGGGGGGGSGGTGSRPVSSYGLGADLGAVGARKSVLINMGAGNFLAVPDAAGGSSGFGGSGSGAGGMNGSGGRRGSHGSSSNNGDAWPRPMSSSSERRKEQRDLWR